MTTWTIFSPGGIIFFKAGLKKISYENPVAFALVAAFKRKTHTLAYKFVILYSSEFKSEQFDHA